MRRPYVQTQSDLARRQRVYLDAPGLYAITLAKGAPEVAAEVRYEPTPDPFFPENRMDRSLYWTVFANGSLHRGPLLNPDWTITGRAIDRAEFNYLIADREHARIYRAAAPEATPNKAVSSRQLDPSQLF